MVEVVHHAAYIVGLVVVDYCIDGDIDTDAEAVGVCADTAYVVDGIGCGRPCAVCRRADIYGVCTVVYSSDGCPGIAGRSKEFKCSHCVIFLYDL